MEDGRRNPPRVVRGNPQIVGNLIGPLKANPVDVLDQLVRVLPDHVEGLIPILIKDGTAEVAAKTQVVQADDDLVHPLTGLEILND